MKAKQLEWVQNSEGCWTTSCGAAKFEINLHKGKYRVWVKEPGRTIAKAEPHNSLEEAQAFCQERFNQLFLEMAEPEYKMQGNTEKWELPKVATLPNSDGKYRPQFSDNNVETWRPAVQPSCELSGFQVHLMSEIGVDTTLRACAPVESDNAEDYGYFTLKQHIQRAEESNLEDEYKHAGIKDISINEFGEGPLTTITYTDGSVLEMDSETRIQLGKDVTICHYLKAQKPEKPKSGLDLNKLEKQLDDALAKETPESLTKWLMEKRGIKGELIYNYSNYFFGAAGIEHVFENISYNQWDVLYKDGAFTSVPKSVIAELPTDVRVWDFLRFIKPEIEDSQIPDWMRETAKKLAKEIRNEE